ncbi:nitrate- and nitrite sensing domain-containing protein [Nocardia sp. NPDC004860]|uniref:sensor histidine kinase n=1 Tax=Nocardia sp. NPDC004860 TaxID=3154557 RepID=UPI0033B55740
MNESSPQTAARRPRKLWRGRSIRTYVLAIALVPSTVLLITGIITAATLADQAAASRAWSSYRSTVIAPASAFVAAVQNERGASIATVVGDQQAAGRLPSARRATDDSLAGMRDMVSEQNRLDPAATKQSSAIFDQLLVQLPLQRRDIDVRQADVTAVDAYYTSLVDLIAGGMQESAVHNSPNPKTLAEEFTAAALAQILDLHSRAAERVAAVVSIRKLDPGERRTIAELNGAFRQKLTELVPRLTESERSLYGSLVNSQAWRTASEEQNSLAERGELIGTSEQWQAAEQQVGDVLTKLLASHAAYAFRSGEDSTTSSIARAVTVGAGVVLVGLAAFLISLTLANRLVRRLRALRTRTLQVANEDLPALIQQAQAGEVVDSVDSAFMTDAGADEIGEVASAFAIAHRTAVDTAVNEARTREGFNKVFLDIAYRSQTVVRRQLELLDVAESKQDDPEHLELLFQLDHLTTRARRNAENLLILGGGQPARRWRKPVALEQIVRSAISETENFARVSALRLPDVSLAGSATADLIHLLSELVDNATAFSPPDSPVSVRGNLVGRGVVIEVEDQGLGIRFEERAALNELLRQPPGFHEMALQGRRHLGLFVVGKLSLRHDISVTLQESAYGGVKAVVLIPAELIGQDSAPTTVVSAVQEPPRSVPLPAPTPEVGASDVLVARNTVTQTALQLPAEDARHPVNPSAGLHRRSIPSRGRAALPRRQRQSHLSPQLRREHTEITTSPMTDEADQPRAADSVRNSMASFQQGTRRGRRFTPPPHEMNE